jgi:signal transduction histidine kinase
VGFSGDLADDVDLRRLSRALALIVLVGAAAVLGGWLSGTPGVARVLSSSMKANTAVCLGLFSASLLLDARYRPWAAAAAAVATALASLTLLQYLAGIDLRIDQMFFRDAAAAGAPTRPGRMAPNTAQALTTLGAALLVFVLAPRGAAVAGGLSLVVAFEAMLALLGYLHGTRSLYQIGNAVWISPYTAAALFLLSIAALARWPKGTAAHVLTRRTAGGILARRLLPPIILIPVLLGLLRNLGERAGLYDDALGTALMTAGIVLFAGILVWQNARRLDRLDEAQRRISAENERLAAEARAAVELRDEFIALASHELRTPLTAMRLQAQLEQRKAEAHRVDQLNRWMRLIERLGRLVETMLDASRLGQQQIVLDVATVDLSSLLSGTVDRLSGVLTARETALSIRTEPGVLVRADPLRLEQAVENVLMNAAKYGAGKEIAVSLVREDGCARVSIRDQGMGIAPADQERIFDRFARAAPSSSFGGLGLGLYLTRQVLLAHGGSVTVESAPGKGATFHLRLPLAPEAGPRPVA